MAPFLTPPLHSAPPEWELGFLHNALKAQMAEFGRLLIALGSCSLWCHHLPELPGPQGAGCPSHRWRGHQHSLRFFASQQSSLNVPREVGKRVEVVEGLGAVFWVNLRGIIRSSCQWGRGAAKCKAAEQSRARFANIRDCALMTMPLLPGQLAPLHPL